VYPEGYQGFESLSLRLRVLIVDDEKNIRLSLKKYLALENIDSVEVEHAEAALACIE
jgi:two-component system response regulator AtoC